MPARLRLEPIGPEHAADLWRLHQDEAVAEWHGGPWSAEDANRNAAAMAGQWRLGMRFAGELPGRGLVEGRPGVHDDARIALCLGARPRWRRRSRQSSMIRVSSSRRKA